MKKQVIDMSKVTSKVQDPNAAAMWGRVKSQTFRDKTKYTRKQKHKRSYEDQD